MKRITAIMLAMLMALCTLALYAGAQEKYAPEVGDGYISFDYSKISCGTVNAVKSATLEKDVSFDGRNALKITPNPGLEGSSKLNLDCYNLTNYANVDLTKYKYAGITYYYDTATPSYEGRMYFRMLPGSTKAVGDTPCDSTQPIVAKKWTEAIFSFGQKVKITNEEKPYLAQFHIRPFSDTAVQNLTSKDVIYIEKITFYEKNPDPNATGTVIFDKNSPGATGEMQSVTVKAGEKYALPECTFEYAEAKFRGWRLREGLEIMQPGDEITVNEGEIVLCAEWDETVNAPDFISIDFTKYAQGVVNSTGAAEVDNSGEKDGKLAVKITPNPECDKSKRISVDGWSYGSVGVDLKTYKYFAVEYFFETKKDIDATMNIAIMNQGSIFTGSAEANATEPIRANTWHTVYFDFTNINLKPELSSHILKQMHIRILGEYPLSQLSSEDVMYISRIMFFKELPNVQSHEGYMNGYEDGTFRPSGTMTRAEACTVVARLLEKEEAIAGASAFTDVPADAWHAKYIGFCEGRGLLASYSGNFLPDAPITRAEFSELVYLTGLAKDSGKSVSFTDVSESHEKYASIKAAASAGLINGYDNGDGTFSFKPDNTITRAEVVTVINRAIGRSMTRDDINEEIHLVFLDTDRTHWAFADIAEATIPHYETSGKWLYPIKDPLVLLGEKFDINSYLDVEGGIEKVKELDALEEKRIAEIRSTPSMDLSHIKGKKIYVSQSSGDNNNDGLSENTPVKTLSKANSLAQKDDAVLLKRGDIWREPMTAKNGVTYSAYGEGQKPTIYGSPENGADPEKWLLVYSDDSGKKVWQYKNTDMTDIGTMVIRDGDREYYTAKVLAYCNGSSFVYKDDKNKKFDYIAELKNDLEFFHHANSTVSGNIINASSATGPVYLRCDSGNPGKVFDSIEFNVKTHGIRIAGHNITIDNICVMYVGSHGISSGTVNGLVVTNCEFGWIGGSIQSYNANGSTDGSPTRFGNGVEVYGGCDGYLIDNCYLWQCYDAGVTHQYSSRSGGDCVMKNITYSNNVITDSIYSIEYFLSIADNVERYGENVLYKSNLCRRAGFGFGGWLNSAHRGAAEHIRSGGPSTNNPFTNYRIEDNIFDRSTYELCQTTTLWENSKPIYSGNTFIGGLGNRFYTYGAETGSVDISSRVAVGTVLGDATGKFYYVEQVPKNQFTFVPSKKVEVTEEDKTRFASFFDIDARLEEEMEDGEILDPLVVRSMKGKKLYADTRKCYTVTEATDEATGITYADVALVNDASLLNMDCYGLAPFDVSSGKIVVKILMRTTEKVKPEIYSYNVVTEDGSKGSGGTGVSLIETTGSNQWEEVYITVNGFKPGSLTCTQIHVVFGGADKRGNQYFDSNGKLIGNPNFDVAAWAIFPNLASAKAYDLKKAAIDGISTK